MANLTNEQLRKLGKEGKLFAVEVLYSEGKETKKVVYANQTATDLMTFRRNLFTCGFLVGISPGHYRLYSPADIEKVFVDRQSDFWTNAETVNSLR